MYAHSIEKILYNNWKDKMDTKTFSKMEILLSGFLFGTIPIFSIFLHRLEISSFQQVFFRTVISIFLLLCMMLMFIKSELLRFNKLDIPIFIWFGFFMTMSQITYLSSLTLGIPAVQCGRNFSSADCCQFS